MKFSDKACLLYSLLTLVSIVQNCRKNSDCASGWCEGGTFWKSGRCDPKRGDGEACRKSWNSQCDDNSCRAGYSTCGVCGKAGNGNTCSSNSDCSTGWCSGQVTWSCRGKCSSPPDVSDGQPCRKGWNGHCDDNTCKSKFSTCGICGNALVGQRCSKNSDCKSGLCDGVVTWPCKGICLARPQAQSVECKETLTDEIFDMNEDARSAAFEMLYAYKFNRLAHREREESRIEMIKKIENDNELKKEFIAWGEKNQLLLQITKMVVNEAKNKAADKLISYALNAYIEQEIIKSTTISGPNFAGKGVQFGTRLVRVNHVIDAAEGARAAFTGVKVLSKPAGKAGTKFLGKTTGKLAAKAGSFIPGISAALGETLARKISNAAGVENHHAKNVIAVGGAVAGGAAAGAIVGGPVGAAVGGAAGIASWGIGVTIDALYTSGLGRKGPNNNWVYIDTGKIDGNVGFLTYSLTDTIYAQNYWQEYRSADTCVFFMSAGNAQNEGFQVSVRDRQDREIVNLKKVYYRDFIHVGKNIRGAVMVAHAKGELWGNSGGKVDLHS